MLQICSAQHDVLFCPGIALILRNRFQKIIKQKLRILWPTSSLRVKLRREERLGFVLDAFAGAVVQVLE